MQKHLSPLELQKIIKKDRRRSKKTLFVLLQKQMNCVSIFFKEPQLERKIFIAFDVVINMDIFEQQKDIDSIEIFSDFNPWRVPIKIEKRYIPNSTLHKIYQKQPFSNSGICLDDVQEQTQPHPETSSSSSQSLSQISSSSGDKVKDYCSNIIDRYGQEEQINDIFKDNNFLIEIELDTNTTGVKLFSGFSQILNSISNQKAHILADKIILYQDFVNKCLQNYHLYEKSLTRILPNFKEENNLDIILFEQTIRSYQLANVIIQQKIQQNKYISYLIKINKEGQQVIQKFGYSKAFLDIMGIHDNYEPFFMRRGPINPFNPRNRLDRLIMGLHKKAMGYPKKIADKYEDQYSNEEIYTIDNIVFKANYTNEKHFLNQSDQYFIKSSFLLQISTYQITEETEKQISRIRQSNQKIQQNQQLDSEKEIQDLQYNCQSEIFLNKYYVL